MNQVQVRVEVSRMGKDSKSKFIQASIGSDCIDHLTLEEITATLVDVISRILPTENYAEDYDTTG